MQNCYIDKDIELVNNHKYQMLLYQELQKNKQKISAYRIEYQRLVEKNKDNIIDLKLNYQKKELTDLLNKKLWIEHPELSQQLERNLDLKKQYKEQIERKNDKILLTCGVMEARSKEFLKTEVKMLDTSVGNSKEMIKRLILDQIEYETKEYTKKCASRGFSLFSI